MSANRHLGRIIALQTLYEQELRHECQDKSFELNQVLERNIARYKAMVDDRQFIKDLVHGINERQAELDEVIQPIAPEWPLDQIARMDRLVLRLGTYELMHGIDIPPKVVINEAVELAKSFGGDNSSKFINGVLGTVLRNQEAKTAKTKKPKPTKPKTAKPKTAKAKPATKKPSPKKTKKKA